MDELADPEARWLIVRAQHLIDQVRDLSDAIDRTVDEITLYDEDVRDSAKRFSREGS